MGWTPYREFDLEALGLLRDTWDEAIKAVVSRESVLLHLDGSSVTSREKDLKAPIPVRVVTGERIKMRLPWLYRLYENELCDLASEVAGVRLFPATDLVSAINLNCIAGMASRYEWHIDTNPLTGLLFVTTLREGGGGELAFRSEGRECIVRPRKGVFLAYDAREIEHSVLPLLDDVIRISAPMNYYTSSTTQLRPADLDGYLYQPEAEVEGP